MTTCAFPFSPTTTDVPLAAAFAIAAPGFARCSASENTRGVAPAALPVSEGFMWRGYPHGDHGATTERSRDRNAELPHLAARVAASSVLRWRDARGRVQRQWVVATNAGARRRPCGEPDAGRCIFRLSKILGHSSVKITQDAYAHIAPQAWEQDYGRVAFHVPSEPAKIYALNRDATSGRIVGRGVAITAAR
jgi:hypothetical protein